MDKLLNGPAPDEELASERTSERASWLSMAAGISLVVAILYVGRDVLIPLAVAILLSFVLAPLVNRLVRWHVSRVLSVVLVAMLATSVLGALGLLIGVQVTELAEELPSYRSNVLAKLRDAREAAPSGGAIDRISSMVQDLRAEIEAPAPGETPAPVVQLREPPASPLDVISDILAPLLGPLGKAGIVVVLVIFILLEQEDLRNRLIRLLGPDLHVTTEVLDEVGHRVSRYLLMQLVVNVTYGIPFGIGLYLIGIPNAFLWAVLAVLLRFIPYVGPLIAAVFPVLLAIAVDPGWTTLLATVGLIVVIELISNNFVEPRLYGASTSVSAVAIIVAAIFWTTLWGPIGLLLATPLTVCLAVIGRYFRQLRFLDVVLGSAPALSLPERFYQRLLAGDVDEDVRIAEEYLKDQPLASFYDDVAIPALRLAAEDNRRGALTAERRLLVTKGALEIVTELADHDEESAEEEAAAAAGSVLCAAGRTGLDLSAAVMLAQLLERRGCAARVVPAEALTPAGLPSADLGSFDAVCLAYLDDAALVRAQQACRRLRRAAPGKPIVVGHFSGRAAPPADALHLPKQASIVTSLAGAVDAALAATGPAEQGFAPPPVPSDEEERLRDLKALGVLGTRSEHLDRLTRRLAEAFHVPISLLSLVDEQSQQWPAQTGLPDELAAVRKSPRETSICGHVVAANDVVIVEDALKDSRFASNPFLLEQGIRFYAGAPLRSRRGHPIGSLCVIDVKPRTVSDSERALLQVVADEVMTELEAAAEPPAVPAAPKGAAAPLPAEVGGAA